VNNEGRFHVFRQGVWLYKVHLAGCDERQGGYGEEEQNAAHGHYCKGVRGIVKSEKEESAMKNSEPMVVVFSSPNFDGELEAMGIKNVLDANSIPNILSGPHMMPNLPFEVQVPAHLLGEAEEILRAARQDGRRAADEGEAATE
jgi:hypothetical protein